MKTGTTNAEKEGPVGDFELLRDSGATPFAFISRFRDRSCRSRTRLVPERSAYTITRRTRYCSDNCMSNTAFERPWAICWAPTASASGAAWDAGTDYTDPQQRKNMLASVEAMVREFKDEPFVLFWVLGNENNYPEFTHTNAKSKPEAYATLLNEAALLIKSIYLRHPVCVSNGETHFLYAYAKHAPAIDTSSD